MTKVRIFHLKEFNVGLVFLSCLLSAHITLTNIENISRKGIARPKSPFPHSCVCERFIYDHRWSAFPAAENMWTDPRNI
jgi:hypothetical protein